MVNIFLSQQCFHSKNIRQFQDTTLVCQSIYFSVFALLGVMFKINTSVLEKEKFFLCDDFSVLNSLLYIQNIILQAQNYKF